MMTQLVGRTRLIYQLGERLLNGGRQNVSSYHSQQKDLVELCRPSEPWPEQYERLSMQIALSRVPM